MSSGVSIPLLSIPPHGWIDCVSMCGYSYWSSALTCANTGGPQRQVGKGGAVLSRDGFLALGAVEQTGDPVKILAVLASVQVKMTAPAFILWAKVREGVAA